MKEAPVSTEGSDRMTKSVKRNFKDTVFRMLFSRPENALALYNSLNGTAYTDVGMLEFNTLENAIYMNVKNDVSFLIARGVNLYEHQSTYNPNMPLRNLLYLTNLLEREMAEQSLYSSKLLKIPTPSFVVFYNGTKEMPERMVLRLSDAFEFPVEDPALELKVTMLNINPGMNELLKEECAVLREYMLYVERVRMYAAGMDIGEAVELAVDECIEEGILREFLLEQKMEVVRMSIYEYDEEKELKIIRADERELGYEEGMEEGIKSGEGRINLLNTRLIELGRVEDVLRAAKDRAYQEKLIMELGIA